MKIERATTIGMATGNEADAPIPPKGKYWKLVGSAAAAHPRAVELVVYLYWFWERDAP